MILTTLSLIFAIVVNLGLGITVYLANRERKANLAYLLTTNILLLWLIDNIFILHSKNAQQAIITISIATALAACIPTLFQLLRLTIKHPADTWIKLILRSKIQILCNIIVCVVCFLPSFIISVSFTGENNPMGLAEPVYGKPFLVFLVYELCTIALLGYRVFRDRKELIGTQRLELEFLLFACLSGLIVGIFLGTVLALILNSSSSVPIANSASVLTLSTIVAYGISMHRILTVSTLLRRITAYVLMTIFLSVIYYLTYAIASFVFSSLRIHTPFLVNLLATLTVAFSMLPTRNRMNRAADRLFSGSGYFDVQGTVKKASDIFQSVTTISSLLDYFSSLLIEAFDTEKVVILSATNTGFEQIFPQEKHDEPIFFSQKNALVSMLWDTREVVCIDNIERIRTTTAIQEVVQELQSHQISVAAGVFSKSRIRGIVIFSGRHRGRVYDKTEQDTLQILCNQFAVALENAQLYTEMQDSKIRNDIMLDQLVSGIIVADIDRKITLFNHEAQRITGLAESQAKGMGIGTLPKPICRLLETTLENKVGVRNVDATLPTIGEEDETGANIRMGSVYLIGHDQKPMGALLVFTDLTELKSLEEQVRRSDQLSSVGTLAAGMAHEIKNPLVTIKTFAQLLPKRFADEDFRRDFSSLVAHEVERIDAIVNQLLSFSKPTKPHLIPMNLHETIAQILKLIQEQVSQKRIDLQARLEARRDEILGDDKLLSQALINFCLNAIEAIKEDGTIRIGTINCNYRFATGEDPKKATIKRCIRLHVHDTGTGIDKKSLQKIFDPFFTKKSEGTGMGLSVSHGIIQEHHGVIEVESEQGRGSTFFIYIPLLEEGTPA